MDAPQYTIQLLHELSLSAQIVWKWKICNHNFHPKKLNMKLNPPTNWWRTNWHTKVFALVLMHGVSGMSRIHRNENIRISSLENIFCAWRWAIDVNDFYNFSFSSRLERLAKARPEVGEGQHLLQAGKLWTHLVLRLHLPADRSVQWVLRAFNWIVCEPAGSWDSLINPCEWSNSDCKFSDDSFVVLSAKRNF